jgi:hypothetical protein
MRNRKIEYLIFQFTVQALMKVLMDDVINPPFKF